MAKKKTLNDVIGGYRPKAGDEQRFMDKHVIVKHPDRNGNGDDVFQGTNIKYNEREEERHGYDAEKGIEVYEDVESLSEIKKGDYYIHSETGKVGKVHHVSGDKEIIGLTYNKSGRKIELPKDEFHKYHEKSDLKEEQLDEISKKTLKSYLEKKHGESPKDYDSPREFRKAMIGQATAKAKLSRGTKGPNNVKVKATNRLTKEDVESINENKNHSEFLKHLGTKYNFHNKGQTSTEKYKGTTVYNTKFKTKNGSDHHLATTTVNHSNGEALHRFYKAGKHDQPASVSYKSKLKEDTEQLDELSKSTLGSYIKKSHNSANKTVKRMGNLEKWAKEKKVNVRKSMEGGKTGRTYKDLEREVKNRDKGISRATDKLTREDVESLDELSKETMWRYAMAAKGDTEFDRGKSGASEGDYTGSKLTKAQKKTHNKRLKGLNYVAHKLSGAPKPDDHKSFGKDNNFYEDVETLDELSKSTLDSYRVKAKMDRVANKADLDYDKNRKGFDSAAESSRKRLIKQAENNIRKRDRGAESLRKRGIGESLLDRIIQNLEPITEEDLSIEERIMLALDWLPEHHADVVFDLFEALNEENKENLLLIAEDPEAISDLLDFAIEHKEYF